MSTYTFYFVLQAEYYFAFWDFYEMKIILFNLLQNDLHFNHWIVSY